MRNKLLRFAAPTLLRPSLAVAGVLLMMATLGGCAKDNGPQTRSIHSNSDHPSIVTYGAVDKHAKPTD